MPNQVGNTEPQIQPCMTSLKCDRESRGSETSFGLHNELEIRGNPSEMQSIASLNSSGELASATHKGGTFEKPREQGDARRLVVSVHLSAFESESSGSRQRQDSLRLSPSPSESGREPIRDGQPPELPLIVSTHLLAPAAESSSCNQPPESASQLSAFSSESSTPGQLWPQSLVFSPQTSAAAPLATPNSQSGMEPSFQLVTVVLCFGTTHS
jgi:hypothetical protein